jgi:hypothetical protein
MQPNHSRKPMYILLALFIVPMLLSWVLFHYHQYFNFKTVNHGHLLNPAINIGSLQLPKTNGWRILHIDKGSCDTECIIINASLAQVQKALGKDQERVSVVTLNGQSPVLTRLAIENSRLPPLQNKIYLVDPLDNVFMYYADNVNQMDVLKDLKRILEVSQIG